MATIEELQADLAKYKAERDRILTDGASHGADGATREAARLETIIREIKALELRISFFEGSSSACAVFGGRG